MARIPEQPRPNGAEVYDSGLYDKATTAVFWALVLAGMAIVAALVVGALR